MSLFLQLIYYYSSHVKLYPMRHSRDHCLKLFMKSFPKIELYFQSWKTLIFSPLSQANFILSLLNYILEYVF